MSSAKPLHLLVTAVVCLAAMPPWGTVRAEDAEKQDKPASEVAANSPLDIQVSLEQAIMMAFDRNPALAVERLKPPIQKTNEAQERAVFDPVLRANYSDAWRYGKKDWNITSTLGPYNSHETLSTIALEQVLPTGTKLTLEEDTTLEFARVLATKNSSAWYGSLRAAATVSQALLRGRGLGPNLARLREARLDTLGSEYTFRGVAEGFVAQVEETYWDYAFAIQQVRLVEESLKLAELQLSDTQEKVKVGKLPETETAAARAEAALRHEEMINAKSVCEKLRLRLLRMICPPQPNYWSAKMALTNEPKPPADPLEDVEDHVNVALQYRPELNEARLGIARGDLEIVRTRNGLLPKMDVFISAGISGYAKAFNSAQRELLNQFDRLNHAGSYDVTAGVNFEFPPINRDANAQYRRATLSRQQAEEAMDNLTQIVQVDVRSAYVEVLRAREQIGATAQTREFREEALRAELAKMPLGKSTNFQLAQAERDVLAARIGEVEAKVNYLKALTELYRLDGSLLLRRHIDAPGDHPAAP